MIRKFLIALTCGAAFSMAGSSFAEAACPKGYYPNNGRCVAFKYPKFGSYPKRGDRAGWKRYNERRKAYRRADPRPYRRQSSAPR